jgi:hypothetical protein
VSLTRSLLIVACNLLPTFGSTCVRCSTSPTDKHGPGTVFLPGEEGFLHARDRRRLHTCHRRGTRPVNGHRLRGWISDLFSFQPRPELGEPCGHLLTSLVDGQTSRMYSSNSTHFLPRTFSDSSSCNRGPHRPCYGDDIMQIIDVLMTSEGLLRPCRVYNAAILMICLQ